MRRMGVAASLMASLAIGAFVLNCSSDRGAGSTDPLIAAGGTDPITGSGPVNLNGGGWTPVVEAASHNKVTVCHSGNGNHFTQVNVSAQGARAHLGDPSSGKGGHSGDYRVTDLTPCPPPATPGQVQICKVAGVGLTAGTNFDFNVTANGSTRKVTVAAGAPPNGTCADGGSYRVGTTVEVTEAGQTGVKTVGIVVAPAGAQQGTSDLAGRRTSLIVGVGTTSATFTNNGPSGTLVICKVGGAGVTAGSNFNFTAGSHTITVAAGAAPNGTCSTPMTLATGAVNISEAPTAGMIVTAIAGTPSPTNVNLVSGSATTQITADQETRITYTNAAATASNSGTLTICKVAGTGITTGTNFSFTASGQSATVAAGAGPTGTCASTPLTFAVGNVVVTEAAAAGNAVSAITASGTSLVSSDLPNRTATVTVAAGQQTTVTFTNSVAGTPTGTLVICKIAGTGVTTGSNFAFTAGGQNVTVAAGAAPNGTCATAITLPAGAATVTETAVAGTSVSAITGTPAAPTNINLGNRSATVQILAGQETRITYTNTAP